MTTTMTDRRSFLGASDVAAALGLSPFKTPLALWLEKTSPEPIPDISNEDIVRGLASEAVIEALLAHRGVTLEAGGEWAIEGTPIVVHPDRLVVGEASLEEFKAPRRWSKHWGEDGSTDVPLLYVVQCQVQAFAINAGGREIKTAGISALCGELRRYPLAYAPDVAKIAIDRALAWWERHIVRGDQPPPHTLEEMAGLTPNTTTYVAPDGPDMLARFTRLQTLRGIRSTAERLEKEEREGILRQASADGTMPSAIEAMGQLLGRTRKGGRDTLDAQRLRECEPEVFARFSKRIEWVELRPTDAVEALPVAAVAALLDSNA